MKFMFFPNVQFFEAEKADPKDETGDVLLWICRLFC